MRVADYLFVVVVSFLAGSTSTLLICTMIEQVRQIPSGQTAAVEVIKHAPLDQTVNDDEHWNRYVREQTELPDISNDPMDMPVDVFGISHLAETALARFPLTVEVPERAPAALWSEPDKPQLKDGMNWDPAAKRRRDEKLKRQRIRQSRMARDRGEPFFREF